ncbi:phosphoenolpyruvate synthase [archaeon D22]|nr:phosphoenolpyruvate synthase [archaeon D22]
MNKNEAFILWFDQLGIEDVGLVGGKNASLGEMYRNLVPKGVNIPNGFAITAYAYHYLLEKAGVKQHIQEILSDLDTSDMENLATRGHKVRETIRNAEFPQELKDVIVESYNNMCQQYGEHTDVAVRSSATAEDLPDASFAGQQETYLNIRGPEQLIEACKKCFASLFTNRAISYRVDKDFDHFSIGLSIGVQKMVRSDKACSGVMFSLDTESGFEDVAFITGAYGLGETVVQGAVNPDEYYVFKPTLKQGYKPIIQKKVGTKQIKMIYSADGSKEPTKTVSVDPEEQKKFVVTEEEILTLAKWAVTIEDHYSEKAGYHKPMDMEWAKDGVTGELFIVQARPETVHSRKDRSKLIKYVMKEKGKTLIEGKSIGEKIGAGEVNVIKDVHDIGKFKAGQVLVTDMTDPDWEPIMKIASAIVTNRGGRTCHAAIISRELGIPCVVGTLNATEKLATAHDITIDCSQGDTGYVYEGKLNFEIEEHDIGNLPETKTKITMNVAQPDQAFEQSFIPNEGVGLMREEFVINSHIKIHPKALINFDNLQDEEVKKKIEELTYGYADKKEFFVDRLAQGVSMIAAAFYPKKVIVRLSDFKSNEYANLIGGKLFEPVEDNPMIGWRGASRYYDDNYKDGFLLECKALKKVREEYGLTNLQIMIPFCRTVEEGKKVLKTMEQGGLVKGENGLEVYVMCEIPANVLLAEEFLEVFDGFSIGSNDLTQLTLGLDRDSELVAHIYDERNAAVKKLIKNVIEIANSKGKYIGICGQAPSDFEDFAQFLVECGIQSISLNPDTVIKTRLKIAEKEKELGMLPEILN